MQGIVRKGSGSEDRIIVMREREIYRRLSSFRVWLPNLESSQHRPQKRKKRRAVYIVGDCWMSD